jgi:S-adenosylmethionine synthetase
MRPTSKLSEEKICAIIDKIFDLRPAAIIAKLKLKRPIYRETARNGHFGRELPDFTWEKLDMVKAIKKEAGLK